MRYTVDQLEYIAEQTGNDCHLCHQPIEFNAYGNYRNPRGWEVDHVRPRSKAGHNGISNLLAAHAHCNRKKGNRSNRFVRSHFGVSGVPPSTISRIWTIIGYGVLAIGALWILFKLFTSKSNSEEFGAQVAAGR